jgi:hypothetical protein
LHTLALNCSPAFVPLVSQVSFRSYWTRVLLDTLRHIKGDVSIKEISDMTMIRGQDIVDTLQVCGWGGGCSELGERKRVKGTSCKAQRTGSSQHDWFEAV